MVTLRISMANPSEFRLSSFRSIAVASRYNSSMTPLRMTEKENPVSAINSSITGMASTEASRLGIRRNSSKVSSARMRMEK